MKPSTTTALLTVMLAVTLSLAFHLDGPDDHRGDWSHSAELRELQASAAHTERRERAAQALCTGERGPNSEARWTPEGDLVCTTRRALVQPLASAQAGRP